MIAPSGGQFLLSTAVGIGLFFPWLSVARIGKGFHQWGLLTVGFLVIVAAALMHLSPFWWVMGGLSVAASPFFSAPPRIRKFGSVLEKLVVLVLGIAFLRWTYDLGGPGLTLDRVSMALLLGAVGVALTVGHWYLVAPGLGFGLLTALTWVCLGVLALRTGVLAWQVFQGGLLDEALSWDMLLWLFRWTFGIGVPSVVLVLTLGALKYHNNQAATGILYVAFVLIVMGEVAHASLAWNGTWGP